MNAKNLMPGDLVMLFGQETEVWMVDVSHEDEKDQFINYLDASEFEPIPITPEYLEKNGFVSNCNKECTYDYYKYENISISRHFWDDKDQWVIAVDAEYEAAGVCAINYIHELQHVMKTIQDDIYLIP